MQVEFPMQNLRLGIKNLIQGNFETLKIEFNEELNKEIINIVNKYKINTVYTHWDGDIHHDHQVVAKSTLHACRHVKNILMYRSNWYQSSQIFNANYYVDITGKHFDKKIEELKIELSGNM